MKFREYLDNKMKLNEMPVYHDHVDYIFKPVEDISMQVIESRWEQLDIHATSSNLEEGFRIYINKSKTFAVLGQTKFFKKTGSWKLVVFTDIKLQKMGDYYQVKAINTNEDLTKIGKGSASTLYYTLFKSGIRLVSDYEQYRGAKPLWKLMSRLINVDIYDDITSRVLIPKYDQTKHRDLEFKYF